jgi:hypothetical protein
MPLLLPRYVTIVLIITSNSNCNSNSFMPAVASASDRLHNKLVRILFTISLRAFCPSIGKPCRFFAAPEVEHCTNMRNTTSTSCASAALCRSSVETATELHQSAQAQRFLPLAAFHSQLKSKVGIILAKATALRINLNIDGAPISSRAHTHPSHSQTSRLLSTALSVGTTFPSSTFDVLRR